MMHKSTYNVSVTANVCSAMARPRQRRVKAARRRGFDPLTKRRVFLCSDGEAARFRFHECEAARFSML